MSRTSGDSRDELRTERTTVKRAPERGAYDFETVARILDEGLYCHVGFAVGSQPYVIPTGYGREGRSLYIHGSAASRMLRALSKGAPVCVTVTLLDGLVLGRSAFHHSMNYRSVMVLGVAREVVGDEKLRGLKVITEHVARGRWADVRPPSDQELKATAVLKLDIEEASAKVRQGPPLDAEQDYGLPCWAGEIPFSLAPQAPVPDGRLAPEVRLPAYLAGYGRPQGRPGD
jgi:nitroimidazol reductase NimA-like FMN-containing flavoprotein (pyridoxamine 5'-phosphate oxidase superfamily)